MQGVEILNARFGGLLLRLVVFCALYELLGRRPARLGVQAADPSRRVTPVEAVAASRPVQAVGEASPQAAEGGGEGEVSLCGDGEAALAALRIALDERAGSRSVLSMKINPLYDFIRNDPRFVDMQKEAGLSP